MRMHATLAAFVATSVSLAAQGGGVVNAPVAPEAIYIGTGSGGTGGLSVLDLNGFGQGTGDLSNTNFPANPNLGAPGVFPPLAPGSSTLDAGGAGLFTLTQDTLGRTNLIDPGQIGEVLDLQIGHPLDKSFNNSNINPLATSASQLNPLTGVPTVGNTISIAPHPNPPRLLPVSPNPAMNIDGEEPTVTSSLGPPGTVTTASPPCVPSPPNLLTSDSGLIGGVMQGVFYGPQPAPPSPPPPPPFCPFTSRQQIGHYLYALEGDRGTIAVYNSNRFTVLDRLSATDIVDIAISPNLAWLAALSQKSGEVRIYDVDPLSPTFHREIAVTAVGQGANALAWQPETEDLLVVNGTTQRLTILDVAGGFVIRNTIADGRLARANSIVAMPRETTSGLISGVYLAYIVTDDGEVVVYESGPNTVGFDTIIGTVGQKFPGAKSIQPFVSATTTGFWIGHRQVGTGLGIVQRIEVLGPIGALPTAGLQPGPRGKTWNTTWFVGGFHPTIPSTVLLGGNEVVDVAVDDVYNAGALPDFVTTGTPIAQPPHSGKGLLKNAFGLPIPASFPRFLFVGLGDTGRVDVFDIATRARITSITTPGVKRLGYYWKQ